jgi:hypothetical protein
MPLVRIDLARGKPAAFRKSLGDIVNLVEVSKENGSFGNGVAQYVT